MSETKPTPLWSTAGGEVTRWGRKTGKGKIVWGWGEAGVLAICNREVRVFLVNLSRDLKARE